MDFWGRTKKKKKVQVMNTGHIIGTGDFVVLDKKEESAVHKG